MDINEEINNFNNPNSKLPFIKKDSFEDYDKVICNRIKRINGELYMLYQELSQGESDEKHVMLWNTIQFFSSSELGGLHEVLKKYFYFHQ